MYNYELSPDEVGQLYNPPREAPTAVTGVYFPFEDRPGKMPIHHWDMENMVMGGRCNTYGGCYEDLIGNNHLRGNTRWHAVDGTGPYNSADCPFKGCAAISQCGQFFQSLDDFDDVVAGSNPKTVSMWVNMPSAAGDGDNHVAFFSMGSECTCGSFALMYIGDARRFATIGCGCDMGADYQYPLNRWIHLVTTYGGAGTNQKMYFNGQKTLEAKININTRGKLSRMIVGADSWGLTNSHQACNLRVDEVKVYDYELTDAEGEFSTRWWPPTHTLPNTPPPSPQSYNSTTRLKRPPPALPSGCPLRRPTRTTSPSRTGTWRRVSRPTSASAPALGAATRT